MDTIERLNQYLALLQIRRKAGRRDLIFFGVLFFGLLLFWMVLMLNAGGNMPASSEYGFLKKEEEETEGGQKPV